MNKDANTMTRNPKETANIFSKILLWWTLGLFLKGSKRDLEDSDIYRPLKEDISENVTDQLEKHWNRELEKLEILEYTVDKDGEKLPLKKNAGPKLYKAIIRTFWLRYFLIGLFIFVQMTVFGTLQPLLQGAVIEYFNTNLNASNKTDKNQALIYAGCLIICIIINITMMHNWMLMSMQTGMRVRVACSSLIYRKLLRLSKTSLSQIGAGRIVNLLSNDVNRFDLVTIYLNFIWVMPLQVIIVGCVMWYRIGVSTFVGLGVLLFISIPIQGTCSLLSRSIRAKVAPLTDRRVQLMSELIAGIQVVKMYAWEKPFSKIVSITRALEINKIKFSSYVRATYIAIMVFTERISLYVTLITFVLLGNNLAASITYVLASMINILQLTASLYFPQALIMLGETMVSINRLEEFLLMDEVDMEHSQLTSQSTLDKSSGRAIVRTVMNNRNDTAVRNSTSSARFQKSDRSIAVELERVSANWVSGQLPPTLCNISLKIKSGELHALVGAVGSGKSSILHLLLRELIPGAGHVIFPQRTSENAQAKLPNDTGNSNISISYASQEPWLFCGTVKDNILFGQSYDKIRYLQVTNVCALTKDFRQLPQGDMTVVGDRGVSLSGGQRARINLARAVYRQADIYLFDDPLSAVDTHVAKHLYRKCITEYLAGKTRILVTHQLQFLKQANHIIVLEKGFLKMQGDYDKLVESNKDFIKMIDSLTMNYEAQKKEEENVRRKSEMSMRRTSILMRRASGLSIGSSTAPSDTDDFSYEEVGELEDEEIEHGLLSPKVYKEYLLHGGNYFVIFLLFLALLISQIATNGTDYWLSYWTNLEELRQNEKKDVNHTNTRYNSMRNDSFLSAIFTLGSDGLLDTKSAIYVYTFCILVCTTTMLLRSFFYMKICMNSSCKLHNSMFSNLLQARMSFFNTNPSGRILNRFSKDIGTMDELLPKTMLEAIQMCLVLCGILIMEVIINYWMVIPMAILAILFYMMIKFYLRTAQHLRRLEGVRKSPLFSHVNSTLSGLPTIRSNTVDIKKMMEKQFDTLQDLHSGAWYLVIACATALGLTLDLILCAFIACICFSFILVEGNTSSASVGLAISQSMILIGGLQYGMKQSVESISLMTAVERVLQYTNLPLEGPIFSDNPPPPTWPDKGQLVFKDVSMSYEKNSPPVLKNLNVSIEPGWKIGVVGRTGAGKSSLISALFRLFDEGLEGEVRIDGRNTTTVGLQELRSKISIIPQEPVLFAESLRYNLDPFGQYNDILLWEVLQKVELNDVALDQDVLYGGHNFSVGQRQLICLARAILRNNNLLVLDEATANIDSHTDTLIQNTIRANFKKCTVITIAHRLNTIIDSDRIIVMDNGYIVEFASPYELLHHKPDGHFSQMVQKMGGQMAQNLYEQAKDCWKNESRQNVNLSTHSSQESDATLSEITEQSAL